MKKFIGFLSMFSIILGACAVDSPDVIGTALLEMLCIQFHLLLKV